MHRPMIRFMIISLLLAWTLLFASCSKEEGAAKHVTAHSVDDPANRNRDSLLPEEERSREPVQGGVLTIAFFSEPGSLNHLTWTGGYAYRINMFLYPGLLWMDRKTFELVPFAAESLPEISEDKKVHTWRLRAGIKWHDFEESNAYLSARDVKFSFELMKDPDTVASYGHNEFPYLKEIKVLDDHTFQAIYEEALGDAVYNMGIDFRIVPAHILQSVPPSEIAGHPIGREPVGYGPFRLHRWKSGEEILLVRDDANREAYPPEFRPYMDGLRFRIVSDFNVQMNLLLRKEVDLIALMPDDWVYKAQGPAFSEVATRHLYYNPYWSYIAWNNRSPLFNDTRVRRAMTHMVRRKEILKSHYHDLTRVLSGPFWYDSKAYDPSIEPLPFDVQEAARLLKEAGWEDRDDDGILDKEIDGEPRKFEFEFTVSRPQGYMKALITSMKEDLQQAGIVMKIRDLDWSIFRQELNNRNFEAISGLYQTRFIYEDLYSKLHSTQSSKGYNRVGYENPEVNEVLERVRREFDDDKRYTLLRRLHALINEDQPYTFLYSPPSLLAINKRWRNVIIHKGGISYFEWWLPPEHRLASDEIPD